MDKALTFREDLYFVVCHAGRRAQIGIISKSLIISGTKRKELAIVHIWLERFV